MARSALSKYRLPVASLLLAAAVAGCDSEQSKADKKVAEDLKAASAKSLGKLKDLKNAKDEALIEGLQSPTDLSEYQKNLESAYGVSAASPPERIHARLLLAHDELRNALALAAKAETTSAEIDALASQIAQQAAQIRGNTAAIAALNLEDPSKPAGGPPVSVAVKQAADLASGTGGEQPWFKTASGPVLSMAAVDKQIADVNGKITEIQGQIDAMQKAQDAARREADPPNEASSAAEHKKPVDQRIKEAEARAAAGKKAADIASDIVLANVALNRAQQDLVVLQIQHDQTDKAAKDIQSIGAGVNTTWQETGQGIGQLKSDSQKILGSDEDPAMDRLGQKSIESSISSKAKAIASLSAANAKTRTNAEAAFKSAIGKYNEAYKIATELSGALNTKIRAPENANKPAVAAWEAERDSLSPLGYLYDQADANLHLANLMAGGLGEQRQLDKLHTAVGDLLKDSGLDMPKAIPEPDLTKMTSAADAVKKIFVDATTEFEQVSTGEAPQARKLAAQTSNMYANYDWWRFNTGNGIPDPDPALNPHPTPGVRGPQSHLEIAQEMVGTLSKSGVAFTELPPELASSMPGAAGAPGTPGASPSGTPAPGFGTPVPAAGGAPMAASMAGTYSVSFTVPGRPGAGYIELILKPDGTFENNSGGSPTGAKPDKKDLLNVVGTYTIDGSTLVFKSVTVDGKPPVGGPDANKPDVWKIDEVGKKVTDSDGHSLTRQ
jgi:hypothetical protein